MRFRRTHFVSLVILFLLLAFGTAVAQPQPAESPAVPSPTAAPEDVRPADVPSDVATGESADACPEATRFEHFAYYRSLAFVIAVLAGILGMFLPKLAPMLYTRTAGGHLYPILVGTVVVLGAPRLLLYLGAENHIARLFCAEIEASRHPWSGLYFWLAFLGSYLASYFVWLFASRHPKR